MLLTRKNNHNCGTLFFPVFLSTFNLRQKTNKVLLLQDGFVLVGSVAGQRYWSSMLNDKATITCGIWTPDDQQVNKGLHYYVCQNFLQERLFTLSRFQGKCCVVSHSVTVTVRLQKKIFQYFRQSYYSLTMERYVTCHR